MCAALTGSNWMQGCRDVLGGRRLADVCILGSHDAGMADVQDLTTAGSVANTQTQVLSIGGQLQQGARYLDIRPCLVGGTFCCGHYSSVLTSYQGSAGQSIESIVQEINTFTTNNKELIILNLSHAYRSDLLVKHPINAIKEGEFDKSNWSGVLQMLQKLNCLYECNSTDNLALKKLNDFIGNGKAAVVVLMDSGTAGAKDILEDLKLYGKGFFYRTLPSGAAAKQSNFPDIYEEYSESQDLDSMISDQVGKLKTKKSADSYFILSWTLTQSWLISAAQSEIPPWIIHPAIGIATHATSWITQLLGYGILDLATKANNALDRLLPEIIKAKRIPNVLLLDKVHNPPHSKDMRVGLVDINATQQSTQMINKPDPISPLLSVVLQINRVACGLSIFVAFLADNDSKVLLKRSLYGINWGANEAVEGNKKAQTRPALCSYKNEIVFSSTESKENKIYVTGSKNGVSTWENRATLPVSTTLATSICALKDRLHILFVEGTQSLNVISSTDSDGKQWGTKVPINEATLSQATMCVHADKLFVAFCTADDRKKIVLCSSVDGTKWERTTNLEDASSKGLSMCSWNGKLWIVYTSTNENKVLLISSVDGKTWSSAKALQHVTTSTAPSICAYLGQLFISFTVRDGKQVCILASLDAGESWRNVGLNPELTSQPTFMCALMP